MTTSKLTYVCNDFHHHHLLVKDAGFSLLPGENMKPALSPNRCKHKSLNNI
jgi:hypothetical protein